MGVFKKNMCPPPWRKQSNAPTGSVSTKHLYSQYRTRSDINSMWVSKCWRLNQVRRFSHRDAKKSSTAAALSDCQRCVFLWPSRKKKKKSANDLFILIYSVCFFSFLFFSDKSRFIVALSQFLNARCWRMEECTAALGLKAERYGAVGATAGRFGKLKK